MPPLDMLQTLVVEILCSVYVDVEGWELLDVSPDDQIFMYFLFRWNMEGP